MLREVTASTNTRFIPSKEALANFLNYSRYIAHFLWQRPISIKVILFRF